MRVLVADDEILLAKATANALRRAHHEADIASDATMALAMLGRTHYDVVVLDLVIPGEIDGWMLLDYCRSMSDPPIVFVVSGHADVRRTVDAMRRGAHEVLEKPTDLAELVFRIERALETATLRRRVHVLESRQPTALFDGEAMRQLAAMIDRVASTPNSSALIVGESGVGKEIVATRIHERSARRSGPFVRVNLAAFGEGTIEGELFGSVRGAFTDSKRDRPGLFASANGGTILLDEICEFRIELQAKLLRVLEERRFFPVGSDRERSINVRVLAATNRDPELAVREGRLRADLYYRLNTITLHVPPLRARRDGLVPLATHLLQRVAQELGRQTPTLTPNAAAALIDHHWPGNVRELRNVLERAVMLTEGPLLDASDLGLPALVPPPAPKAAAAPPADSAPLPATAEVDVKTLDDARKAAIHEVERDQIVRMLERAGGSRTRAAQLLGISRTTLWEKLRRYRIDG